MYHILSGKDVLDYVLKKYYNLITQERYNLNWELDLNNDQIFCELQWHQT